MVTPEFTKRQIAFLGLGVLLPACYLWLILLDSPPWQVTHIQPSAQTPNSDNLQRYSGLHKDEFSQTVDAAMVYSPQQVSATLKSVNDNTLALEVQDALPADTVKLSDHLTGRLTKSTILAFTISNSTSPYRQAGIHDLRQNQAVQLYGRLSGGVIEAALILLPPVDVSRTPLGSLPPAKISISPIPPPQEFRP